MRCIIQLFLFVAVSTISHSIAFCQNGRIISFVITTGNDDFRAGSNVYFLVNLNNGVSLPEVKINTKNERYRNNSSISVSRNLDRVVELSSIRSITLRFNGGSSGTWLTTTDNWNLDAIQISLVTETGNTHLIYNSREDPARRTLVARFTSSFRQVELTRQLPSPTGPACNANRLSVLTRNSTCANSVDIIFPNTPFTTLNTDCGEIYFPGNRRRDVWYSFVMPASGRVAIDFNRVTTALLYSGNCSAPAQSGACRLDAGGNWGEQFIDFRSPSGTVVYLRVFGNAGSRHALCLYEFPN